MLLVASSQVAVCPAPGGRGTPHRWIFLQPSSGAATRQGQGFFPGESAAAASWEEGRQQGRKLMQGTVSQNGGAATSSACARAASQAHPGLTKPPCGGRSDFHRPLVWVTAGREAQTDNEARPMAQHGGTSNGGARDPPEAATESTDMRTEAVFIREGAGAGVAGCGRPKSAAAAPLAPAPLLLAGSMCVAPVASPSLVQPPSFWLQSAISSLLVPCLPVLSFLMTFHSHL